MQLSFSHTLHPKSQRAAGKRWTRRNQHVQTSSGVPLLDVLRNSLNSVLKTHLGQQKWVLKQKTLTFRSQTLPAYLGPQPRNSDGHRKYMVRVTGLPSLNRLSRKWNLKWIHLSNSSLIFLSARNLFLPKSSRRFFCECHEEAYNTMSLLVQTLNPFRFFKFYLPIRV